MADKKGFWNWYDRAARLDFAGTLAAGLFSIGGGILTMFTAASEQWSVTASLLAFVFGFGVFAFVAAGLLMLWRKINPSNPEIGSLENLSDDSAQLPAPATVEDWKRPLDAIEAFADKALIATRDKESEKFTDSFIARDESGQAIFKLEQSTELEKDKKLDFQRRKYKLAEMQNKWADEELRRAWTALRADIEKRLEASELVAKGIPAPYAAGKAEIEISPHEWRLLEINPNEKAEAIERGGGGAKYVGVVIGRKTQEPVGELAPLVLSPAVKINFEWKPGNTAVYEINAIVTPNQNLKNFALMGALADVTHYANGTAKWIWEPARRLIEPGDLFKSEIRVVQILWCYRDSSATNPMVVFNEKSLDLKEDQLLMFRVIAVSDVGTVHRQEAYQVRRIGEAIIVDPIHQDHISFIEGANDGL